MGQAHREVQKAELVRRKKAQKTEKNGKTKTEKTRISNNTSNNNNNTSRHTMRKFPCLYTNTDCLTNKMSELKNIIEMSQQQPLVIGITEVKPKNHRYTIEKSELKLEEYDMHPCNISNETGRGIVLYTHKDIRATEYKLKSDFIESVWVTAKLNKNDKLLIGLVYRSPSSTDDNSKLLNDMIRSQCSRGFSHVLIMGDFNMNSINWNTWTTNKAVDSTEYNFIETVRDSYLHQHIQEPTRARGSDEPSLIDLVLTNEENMITDIKIESPIGKSDHSVIHFSFNSYIEIMKSWRTKILYHKGDYEKIREVLDCDWARELRACSDISEMWEVFSKKLNSAIEKYIPCKKIENNNSKRQSMPMTEKDRAKVRKKHRCWQRYMDTKDGRKYREYCRARNQVRRLTRRLHKSFEAEIAKNAKTNPKRFWAYVKSKTKTKDGISDLYIKDADDQVVSMTESDEEKAEALSKQFASVFTQESEDSSLNIDDRALIWKLENIQITEEIIRKKLKALKVGKSPGPDNIHPYVLHELHDVLAQPLCLIFRHSVQNGKLPEEWKDAYISAIFKKGDRKEPSNYRPVSLTSVVCKVLESIIRDHLVAHMKRNKLFSNKQFGFIQGRATTLQLLNVLDRWTEIIDKKGSIDVIYMDFQKAFDKVPHHRLVKKIESYGIKGDLLVWIKDFLRYRKQQVVVNGQKSRRMDVTSGIPQGSVLGPLLFVIFINDLPDAIENCETFMFADDTKLFRQVSTKEEALMLQSDLNRLETWSNDWLLKFHPQKCKVMTIGLGSKNNTSVYTMNDGNGSNIVLDRVANEKDIGVTIDSKLSFETHIHEKINKANKMMGLIRRTFDGLNEENFILLYKGLVRPHLEYANAVWSPYKKKDIKTVENVQRRATKLIPSLRHLSYEQRLKKLKLPTLRYRRARGDMIEYFKIMGGVYDTEVTKFLPPGITIGTTRGHNKRVYVRQARLNLRKNVFGIRNVLNWNALPKNVIEAPNIMCFERRLDKLWEGENFKYDWEEEYVGGAKLTDADEMDVEAELGEAGWAGGAGRTDERGGAGRADERGGTGRAEERGAGRAEERGAGRTDGRGRAGRMDERGGAVRTEERGGAGRADERGGAGRAEERGAGRTDERGRAGQTEERGRRGQMEDEMDIEAELS